MKRIWLHATERQRIEQAQQGQRKAQQALFEQHAPKMLRVCRMYLSDAFEAEEALMTAFLKVFTHLDQFTHQGSFEGWIRRIVVNTCLSALREKKIMWPTDPMDLPESVHFEHDHRMHAEAVQQALDQLPEGYRTVFVLYAIEGYKHAEIAQQLGISEGTSKSQLAHARKALQLALSQQNAMPYENESL